MLKVQFSAHSLLKIEILRNHKVLVTTEMIEEIVRSPERVDNGYKGRRVAQGTLDETHVLRVVYEEVERTIRIVTVYPGRRARYEKNPI